MQLKHPLYTYSIILSAEQVPIQVAVYMGVHRTFVTTKLFVPD